MWAPPKQRDRFKNAPEIQYNLIHVECSYELISRFGTTSKDRALLAEKKSLGPVFDSEPVSDVAQYCFSRKRAYRAYMPVLRSTALTVQIADFIEQDQKEFEWRKSPSSPLLVLCSAACALGSFTIARLSLCGVPRV